MATRMLEFYASVLERAGRRLPAQVPLEKTASL